MKKVKYIAIEILSVATLLLGVAACTVDDTEVYGGNGDGVFRLSAEGTVYTRAGEDSFTPGTKFQLFAISNGNWGENMLAETPDKNYVVGTETEEQTISYEGNNKFKNHTLDFYGVTTSGRELLDLNTSGDTPTFSVKYDTESQSGLPDILWAEKTGQTFNQSGTITLPFKHVLSKLKLKVQKHKGVTNKLAITQIDFCDYASGTLDVSTGKFTSGSGEVRKNNYYTVFKGNQVLEEASKDLTHDDGKNVEPTVFPTRGENKITDMENHSLGIKITMSNGNSYTYWTNELALDNNNQPIKDNQGNMQYKPYQFKPNYEYDVQLTVTDEALVVTILPLVYDWIPKDESQKETEIGNPVTFGGVTWMDRNLGATSADPTASEMDWEKSRGFYYQFGRSIPFFVEGSMQDPLYENSTTVHAPKCNGDNKTYNAKPLPYVPFMSNYRKLTQHKMKKSSDAISADKIAKLPKDKTLDYRFIFMTDDLGDSYRDWDWYHTTSKKQWDDKANQPCPKGWRLPTKDEFLTIYPNSSQNGDITFRFDHGRWDSSGKAYLEPYNIYNFTREVYVGVRVEGSEYGIIYAIKNRFTNKAYRLRWRAVHAKDNPEYRVLEISRYPATSKDDLNITAKSEYHYSKYDWDHPTEVLRLPISGYIHADATNATIIYSGIETIYWTSEVRTGNPTASSIRMKLGGTEHNKELTVWDDERRGYGCLIRCVRDNSVKD